MLDCWKCKIMIINLGINILDRNKIPTFVANLVYKFAPGSIHHIYHLCIV
jgi:hypothetical protein